MKRNPFLLWLVLFLLTALVVRVEAVPPPTPPSHAKDTQAPQIPASGSDRLKVVLYKDGVTLPVGGERRRERFQADLKILPSVATGSTESVPVAAATTPVTHNISTAASSGYGAMGLILVLVSVLASRKSVRYDS